MNKYTSAVMHAQALSSTLEQDAGEPSSSEAAFYTSSVVAVESAPPSSGGLLRSKVRKRQAGYKSGSSSISSNDDVESQSQSWSKSPSSRLLSRESSSADRTNGRRAGSGPRVPLRMLPRKILASILTDLPEEALLRQDTVLATYLKEFMLGVLLTFFGL